MRVCLTVDTPLLLYKSTEGFWKTFNFKSDDYILALHALCGLFCDENFHLFWFEFDDFAIWLEFKWDVAVETVAGYAKVVAIS